MRCLHPVNTKLLAASVPLTLAIENASAVGTFHTDAGGRISTAGLTAAVKRLVPAAQGNWFITIASQVKLWAPQHHQDIGSATAHPNLFWMLTSKNSLISRYKYQTCSAPTGSGVLWPIQCLDGAVGPTA